MTDKEKLEKIRSEVIWYIHLRNEGLIIGSCGDFEKLLKFIDSIQEEPVSEDLEDAASRYAKEEYNHKGPATLPDRCRGCYAPLMYAFKAGGKWQFEKIKEVLLSEVLPCFMHGGEADEVVAKLDEVLNQK